VMLAGVVFVVGSSLLGWVTGHAIDTMRQGRTIENEVTSIVK